MTVVWNTLLRIWSLRWNYLFSSTFWFLGCCLGGEASSPPFFWLFSGSATTTSTVKDFKSNFEGKSLHGLWCYVIFCTTLRHAIRCHSTPCSTMLCPTTPHHATPHRAMPRHAIQRNATQRHQHFSLYYVTNTTLTTKLSSHRNNATFNYFLTTCPYSGRFSGA